MKVRLIARPQFIELPEELGEPRGGQLQGPDAQKIIETAGRTCYDSFGQGRDSDEYAEHILEVGHGSVLEHAQYTFFITGVSRGMTHELVRHRIGVAISQRCLSGDTVVTFVRGGNPSIGLIKHSLSWLYERWSNPRLRPLLARLRPRVLNESTGEFEVAKLLDVVRSGVKSCFSVVLDDGKTVTCTEDHRIFTDKGWKTLKEIASPSITAGGLVAWNKENDCKVAVNGLRAVGNGKYLDSDWMRRRYIEEGVAVADIANETGAALGTIRTYLSRYKIRKREMGDFLASPVTDRGWLYEKYRVLGWSHARIAEEAGCNPAVVHNYCRKFGIQKHRSEINAGRVPWNKGKAYSQTKSYSQEAIEKYRLSKMGSKNPMWRGGRGTEERRAFHAWKRKNGRQIFERDGWRCMVCNKLSKDVEINSKHMRKRRLEIHHILPLWNRPDLACDPGNMATVCWKCQSTKLNGNELSYAPRLLEAIKSPVAYVPSERTRPMARRVLRARFIGIKSITFAGDIDTYDLVVEGPHHGFVGNGVVVHNSTRYVNETGSPWIFHPLLNKYLDSREVPLHLKERLTPYIENAVVYGRTAYKLIVEALQRDLIDNGVDEFTARKQARGAARGLLGNALETELVWSANVRALRGMLEQRANPAADAEIRELAHEVWKIMVQELPIYFKDYEHIECPDGLPGGLKSKHGRV